MQLTMRELKGDDLFTMLNIVGQLEIEDEFKALFETNINEEANKKIVELKDHSKKKATKKEIEDLEVKQLQQQKENALRSAEFGAKIISKFIRNANKLRDEINPFLADLTDTDVKTIKQLSLLEYTGLIKGFIQKEELKDFFSSIATLL